MYDAPTLLLARADTARAVASVYTASLLATIPIISAVVVGVLLRRASAAARVLVWRSAVVTLLLLLAGRLLQVHGATWTVPSALAFPIVAFGRLQVASSAPSTIGGHSVVKDVAFGTFHIEAFASALCVVYAIGCAVVLLPTFTELFRARRDTRRASRVPEHWVSLLDALRSHMGIARTVALCVTRDTHVPMTFGWRRPVVALPAASHTWTEDELRLVLLHELSHIRSADWLFNLLGRATCALLWFHPGVWWINRRLREDCEVACDDHVIAAGARRSDYATLLVGMAARFARTTPAAATGLVHRTGLRARLTTLLDPHHAASPVAVRWVVLACLATATVAAPASAVRLAPSRDVLTSLMRDAQWESRAYAVLGLAQRPDSVADARRAAEHDPNPRVRAWARYALGLAPPPDSTRAIFR